MKTNVLAIALIGLMLFALPIVAAEETLDASAQAEVDSIASDNLAADPGVTPDSAMYGLKTGWEKLGLMFTFNQEKKAQKELALAEKKLLEVKKMAEKGNVKAMERAQERHDALLERARLRLDSIQEDTEESQVKITAEKIVGLQRAIAAHENRIEVLKDILAEQNLSDEARTAIETAVAKMENKTQAIEQKLEERKDKIKTRLRAVTEKTDSEVSDDITEIEDREGLTAAKKAIAERRIQNTEEALIRVKAKVAEEKAAGTDVSSAEASIAEAEKNLADAKVLLAEGKYGEAISAIKPVSNYGRNLSVVVQAMNQARKENRTEKVQELVDKAKEDGLTLREEVKQEVQERAQEKQEAWNSLSSETREEIKTAIRTQIQSGKSE
ncbi:MAG: DUF5667 domain-containing protein [archaeon]|nr:DUF5667 domain-containing protein [archaeon]